MITWKRAPKGRVYFCGLCGTEIATGDPLQIVTVDRVARVFVRCQSQLCGGPAPPNLPEHVELDARHGAPPVSLAGLLPLDWRPTAASLRAREPGEDD